MNTITFYSFKGGVGRTMALVNVGLELVRRGSRVLLMDFDLEAPGLTSYPILRPKAAHPGVVEYVTEYMRTEGQAPDVSRFVYQVDLARTQRRRKRGTAVKRDAPFEKGGQLWIMPAGKGDTAYGTALSAINWASLYEDFHGFLFFEDMKLQWQKAINPHYVLIDSRTGYTDVGGICTRQLADAVVIFFTPNEQNLTGLKHVCDDIRREETEGLKKKIGLHFVAANLPDLYDERGVLDRQLRPFRKLLGFHDLAAMITRYDSWNLLDQPIVVIDQRGSKLARGYIHLREVLVRESSGRLQEASFELFSAMRDVVFKWWEENEQRYPDVDPIQAEVDAGECFIDLHARADEPVRTSGYLE